LRATAHLPILAPAALSTPTIWGVFLGDDLLPWLLLALGAALGVGNVMAIVRPPENVKDGELERAPVARSIGMAVLGFLVAAWGLASLIGK